MKLICGYLGAAMLLAAIVELDGGLRPHITEILLAVGGAALVWVAVA